MPVATIRSANAITLFTEDGKIVHRLVYQVVNSAKQFLEVGISEESDIWSVFVDNKPVESAINSDGRLLVPLIRSHTTNNQLRSFPVEIVYASVQDRFSGVGSLRAMLPPADLLTSRLIWSVYLPNDYAYMRFASTLEKEEMIRGLNLFAAAPREYDEGAMRQALHLRGGRPDADMADQLDDAYKRNKSRSKFRNSPVGEEEVTRQMQAEIAFSSRLEELAQEPRPGIGGSGTGVLPIQIRIPTGGQVYRFARTIIREEDPLTMSVSYSAKWVLDLLKWILLILILLILFVGRKALARAVRGLGGKTRSIHGTMGQQEGSMKLIAQSIITPIVLLGLLIAFLSISSPLAALVFFLLWISVIYQVILWRRRKARERSSVPPDPAGGASENRP